MASEQQKLVLSYFEDVWNNGNVAAMSRYANENCICHDPYEPDICGVDNACKWVSQMRETIANGNVLVEDIVEEGNYIACRLRHTGEHRGEFLGRQPTGARIVNAVMILFRIEQGRFQEAWQHWDALGVCRQIDATSNNQALPAELNFDRVLAPQTQYNLSNDQCDANKATVVRWMDGAWNHHKLDLVDECFTEDMWFWDPFGPVVQGREGFREWASFIDTAFPNRTLSIDHVIAEGNKTVYRVTLKTKHEGDFIGIAATEKDIEASAMVFAVHENGCYKHACQIFDVLKVLRDIGKA